MSQPITSPVALVLTLLGVVHPALGDPNDWVNVDYVRWSAQSSISSTEDARSAIIRGAESTARNGPWSVTNSGNVLPPSNDPHDYLSWAPYHWPNCNWCNGTGRTHLVHPGDETGNGTSPSSDNENSGPPVESPHPDNSDFYSDASGDGEEGVKQKRSTLANASPLFVQPLGYHRRTRKGFRHAFQVSVSEKSESSIIKRNVQGPSQSAMAFDDSDPSVPFSQATLGEPSLPNQVSAGIVSLPASGATSQPASGTPAPAQAAAKTSKSSCTPSPSSSLPPSATWTTCPYVSRDGQVNPDVRTLNGPGSINSVSQAILYNSIAYAFRKSVGYSQNVARLIDVFFLDPSTKMNSNMNFGQIVRGPGPEGRAGTFTGVLDLRGLVKIVNGILVMKAAGSPDWMGARDQAMRDWMSQYSGWLTNSDIGKSTASRPNNHGSFYVSQVAVAKMLAGDNSGAAVVLQQFFSTKFLDQIATSGEQPFEAVRTRPYHYRCFNLEALITNAKLGDQLGLNLWTAQSKYGATIQTAANFIMAIDPKGEVSELVPHIAAIMAAYGDPTGKYAAFLKKSMTDYQSKPFWFYDQTIALPNSPAAKVDKRSIIWAKEGSQPATGGDGSSFRCPSIFDNEAQVEIDTGIFVTCDELKPFYEIPNPEVL